MSTCGDAACTLLANHGGDFHIGREVAAGIREAWPKASAREACAARGIVGVVHMKLTGDARAERRLDEQT